MTWVPFEIHPETPQDGVLLSDKFKHLDREAMFSGLNQSGKPYGIRFNRLERLYNSRRALEVSELARDKGVYDTMHDLIFTAYFQDRKNISDPDVLCDLAEKAGLSRAETMEALSTGMYGKRLEMGLAEGRERGISAVPTFVFSDHETLTGAQPLNAFKYILSGGTNTSPLQSM